MMRADGGGPSPLGARVRRRDPDRFLLCLAVPPAAREAAFALVALNDELARAVEIGAGSSRDPDQARFAALVRLQFWREGAAGGSPSGRANPGEAAGEDLPAAIAGLRTAGLLREVDLEAMLEARTIELEGIRDRASWLGMLERGAGTLARALGVLALATEVGTDAGSGPALDWLAASGAAYGAGASLRHAGSLIAGRRAPFPADALARHGLGAGSRPDLAALSAFVAELAQPALALLPRGRMPDARPGLRGLALQAVLARRDLARARAGITLAPGAAPSRGIGDRFALLAAGLSPRP